MDEIVFVVEDAPEGGYIAGALGQPIFIEADDLVGLHQQIRDAVRCHFDENSAPQLIPDTGSRIQVVGLKAWRPNCESH